MNKTTLAVLLPLILALCLPFYAKSQTEPEPEPDTLGLASYKPANKGNDNVRTVMIINSYYNNSPIPRNLLKPILSRVAQEADLCCDVYYLNGHLINDSTTYNNVVNNFVLTTKDTHPDYVVMIGKIAFTLRDKVKEMFGDIPMLLLGQTDYYADLRFYFSGRENPSGAIEKHPLAELRDEYNFTTVIWPDFYKQTVDMMVKMRPQMKTLIFISDELFYNRNINFKIRDYVLEQYPGIKYRWLPSSYENAETFQQYISKDDPSVGLLISSWSYGSISPKGYLQEWSDELNLVSASSTPIFCYNQAFMEFGAIGGAFVNINDIQSQIADIFEQMLEGKSMRDVPFYSNFENFEYVVSYPVLKEYNISSRLCPDNTVYIDKPATLWDQYHWEILAITILVLSALFLLWKHNQNQTHKILILNRHRDFVSKMPISFSKGEIVYDKNGAAVNVEYTMRNEAFDKLLKANSDPETDFVLFPKHVLLPKVEEVVKERKPVRFTYKFESSGLYYDFIISYTNDGTVKANTKLKELDIFAINITERMEMENKMKELTRKLDLTINVAKIIPWEWNLKTDELIFDAYSIFERISHNFNVDNGKVCVLDAMDEYFPLMHPDDVPRMRQFREDLFSERTESVRTRYRLRIVKDGKEYYQWVEIRGQVVKTDAKGHPQVVAGAMWQIDEDLVLGKM